VIAVPPADAIDVICRRAEAAVVCGSSAQRRHLAQSDASRIADALVAHRPGLPGLTDDGEVERFAELLAEKSTSDAHLKALIHNGALLTSPTDPHHPDWEPYGAIVALHAQGEIEEATWLAFLATHIGPHDAQDGDYWHALRMVYLGLGDGTLSWARVVVDPDELLRWQERHEEQLARLRFGNHRKFESWKHFAEVLSSYVTGVLQRSDGTQRTLFASPTQSAADNFDRLMHELQFIYRFSRLGIYDLLCLLGSLGVYQLEPGQLYLRGASGPLEGARLLFGGNADPDELDRRGCALATKLGVSVGAMEDALCNWQKGL